MRPASRIVVPEEAAGSRLDVFLARHDPDLSRSLYQRVIAEGRVRLQGRPAKKWDRVAAGDVIEVEPFELPSAGPVADPSVPLVVVHEDEAIVVVDKPAGVPVHPHRPGERGTLANALVARYPELKGVGPQPLEPGLVHRLDTDTSGLLVVARTPAAFRALAAQFAERRVEKVYVALVLGRAPGSGTITTPIGHHPTDRRRMLVEGDPAGPPRSPRPAVTHFAVLRRYAGYTELEVRIDTGRMHQIRAHLASIGHPVAGDVLYQTPADFRCDRLGLSRPFLHAARLAFDHPQDGRRVTFTAPLPPDLATALARLPEAQLEALPPPAPAPPAARKSARRAGPRFIRRPGGGRQACGQEETARLAGTPRPGEVFGPGAGKPSRGKPHKPDARRAGVPAPSGRPGRPSSAREDAGTRGEAAPPRRGGAAARKRGPQAGGPDRPLRPGERSGRRPRR